MNLKTIQHIDQLVKNQSTGPPSVLAEKLNLSERAVYKYLKFMKEELNAPIVYSKVKASYRYSESGKFGFTWRGMNE